MTTMKPSSESTVLPSSGDKALLSKLALRVNVVERWFLFLPSIPGKGTIHISSSITELGFCAIHKTDNSYIQLLSNRPKNTGRK